MLFAKINLTLLFSGTANFLFAFDWWDYAYISGTTFSDEENKHNLVSETN